MVECQKIQITERLMLIWNSVMSDKLRSSGIANYRFVDFCVFESHCDGFLLSSINGRSSAVLNSALPEEIEENWTVFHL